MSSLAVETVPPRAAWMRRWRRLMAAGLAPAPFAMASPALAFDRRIDEITRLFGLPRLDGTELTLLAIFLIVASALLALLVGRVLQDRTFGALANTALALAGALGGLHLYARYAVWHGGMGLGLSALACLAGALGTIILLSLVRNWILDETDAVLAGKIARPGRRNPPPRIPRGCAAR